MKGKIIPMIGVAAVFGAISIFVADMWLDSAANARVQENTGPVIVQQAEPQVEFSTLVVASEPLRYGQAIDAELLREIPWPEDSLPDGGFSTIAELTGTGPRVVLSPMEPNEPVLLTKLSGPNGRATLSNLLSPGMRAVTIKIDEVAGVAGFIAPGDRVDVVLTRAGEEKPGGMPPRAGAAVHGDIVSEVVVESVKVLTVGQGADERSVEPNLANSVTVEVTPNDAGKIALARSVGQLSLSLRSAGDTAPSAEMSQGFGSLLQQAAAAASAAAMPEKKKEPVFSTVIVTRGTEPETYSVPATEANGAAAGEAPRQ